MKYTDMCDAGCEECTQSWAAYERANGRIRTLVDPEALEALPVYLTVYTGAGEVTVYVREDSIEMQGTKLIAEGTVENDKDRLFTFANVIGYSTKH